MQVSTAISDPCSADLNLKHATSGHGNRVSNLSYSVRSKVSALACVGAADGRDSSLMCGCATRLAFPSHLLRGEPRVITFSILLLMNLAGYVHLIVRDIWHHHYDTTREASCPGRRTHSVRG